MNAPSQTVDEQDLASPNFDAYRDRYEVRPPNLERQLYEDETFDLSAQLEELRLAPAHQGPIGAPPSGATMHLWLVKGEGVGLALEQGEVGRATKRGRLSHTNLSGGASAYAGGELWFRDEESVWVTGGSSRYPPRSPEELTSLVEGFMLSGYKVCSCGWDREINGPSRLFRGEERWLSK